MFVGVVSSGKTISVKGSLAPGNISPWNGEVPRRAREHASADPRVELFVEVMQLRESVRHRALRFVEKDNSDFHREV